MSRDAFTHFDAEGRAAMVDVSAKTPTNRLAVASCRVRMAPETLRRLRDGEVEKGDALACARIAGIQAAKRTGFLIPLCHPLALTHAAVDFRFDEARSLVEITASCRTCERTGVEMEALTACATAALTLYDMCKAVDRGMSVDALRLDRKEGGRSGTWTREGDDA